MPHTPGPWKEVGEEFDGIRVITNHPMPPQDHSYGDQTVVGSSDWTFVRHEDARLIAAAPDLLAALKGLEWQKQPGTYCDHAAEPCPRCEAARAAVTKAEGATNG